MKSSILVVLMIYLAGRIWFGPAEVPKFEQAEERPNIVWITCEDMSPHLGCYGEKIAKTPNLDQLASEGIRYTNAFSTAGVCAPSRSTIITGMFQTEIGTQHMRTLRKSPAAPLEYPSNFEEYSAVIPAHVKCFPEYFRAAGYYCTNNFKQDYQFEAPPTAWDESGTKAHFRKRPNKNQPFFAIFNFETSHEGKVHQSAHEPLLVDPSKVEVPPYYPDNEIIRKDLARFLTNVMKMDAQVGEIIQQLKEDGLYDNTIIFFYSDHGDGLPYVKREILDRGMRVPMIVKLPKGPRNVVDERKISFIDLVPTVLSLAHLSVPKHLPGKVFVGDQASQSGHAYIFGARDRMDSEYDQVRSVHDGRFQYIRNFMPNLPRYQHIRSRLNQPMMPEILRLRESGQLNAIQMRWFESKPVEELYDVQADPYQFNDLAKNPQYSAKLQELRKALSNWQRKHDPYLNVPEMEMVKSWWQGNQAPVTATPVLEKQGTTIVIRCATIGASIGFKNKAQANWMVYHEPIQLEKGDSLYVVAQRIGYQKSEILKSKH